MFFCLILRFSDFAVLPNGVWGLISSDLAFFRLFGIVSHCCFRYFAVLRTFKRFRSHWSSYCGGVMLFYLVLPHHGFLVLGDLGLGLPHFGGPGLTFHGSTHLAILRLSDQMCFFLKISDFLSLFARFRF